MAKVQCVYYNFNERKWKIYNYAHNTRPLFTIIIYSAVGSIIIINTNNT